MPFIPHTETDVAEMLASIGVPSLDALFDEIPPELNCGGLIGCPPGSEEPSEPTPKGDKPSLGRPGGRLGRVPAGLSEMAVTRLMHKRAAQDGFYSSFLGAGAYEHHIPAAVWQIVTRGEYYSAYTPYQAE